MTLNILNTLQTTYADTRGDTWSFLYQALLDYTGRTEGHINNLLIEAWLKLLNIAGPYDFNLLQYRAAQLSPLRRARSRCMWLRTFTHGWTRT